MGSVSGARELPPPIRIFPKLGRDNLTMQPRKVHGEGTSCERESFSCSSKLASGTWHSNQCSCCPPVKLVPQEYRSIGARPKKSLQAILGRAAFFSKPSLFCKGLFMSRPCGVRTVNTSEKRKGCLLLRLFARRGDCGYFFGGRALTWVDTPRQDFPTFLSEVRQEFWLGVTEFAGQEMVGVEPLVTFPCQGKS